MKRRRKTHRRGRTEASRLRLVDEILQRGGIALGPKRRDPLEALDVGFGDSLVTTIELGRTLSRLVDRVACTGIEVDEARVATAREELSSRIHWPDGVPGIEVRAERGGLGFDPADCEAPTVEASLRVGGAAQNYDFIRCCNVLRGYGKFRALAGRRALIERLAEGGTLLEGSTDRRGHVVGIDWWVRHGGQPRHEGLVVATDFGRGFAPMMFRDVLPRYLRRECVAGHPVFEWLSAWSERVDRLRTEVQELPQLFEQSLEDNGEYRKLWVSGTSAAALLSLRAQL